MVSARAVGNVGDTHIVTDDYAAVPVGDTL
jgi:hypothetical protein